MKAKSLLDIFKPENVVKALVDSSYDQIQKVKKYEGNQPETKEAEDFIKDNFNLITSLLRKENVSIKYTPLLVRYSLCDAFNKAYISISFFHCSITINEKSVFVERDNAFRKFIIWITEAIYFMERNK